MSISKLSNFASESIQKIAAKKPAISSKAIETIGATNSTVDCNVLDALAQQGRVLVKKQIGLKDVIFSKGLALDKNGKNFSGLIEDKLPNGDSIKLLYKDGVLQQSAREGSVRFDKCYFYKKSLKDVIKINYNEPNRILGVMKSPDNREIKLVEPPKEKIACFELYDNGKLKFAKLFNDDTMVFDENGKLVDDNDYLGMYREMLAQEKFNDFSFHFQPLFKS